MKHLSILVPDEQTNLSTIACIVGAYQIFSEANNFLLRKNEKAIFKMELVGARKNEYLMNDFFSLRHQVAINEIDKTDLIIVPASLIRSYETATKSNKLLIDWLTIKYKEGAEIASMCAGSFTLASTGILSGKTCSTHWALAENFKELYPDVNLQTDQLITDEHGIYTNGGAYSFLNLLIYLIEKFYGRQTAIHCTKYFQIDIDRNLQAEFSIFNGHKKHKDDAILMAQKFLEQNYQNKISIEKLSSDLNLNRRNFDRRFIKATGFTPLDYLQRVKMEAAKKMFETSRKTVNEIMYEVGYNDAKAFREVFIRITGLLPMEYKLKYSKEGRLSMG